MTPKKKALENTVENGENARNQHFLFSDSVFYSIKETNSLFSNA